MTTRNRLTATGHRIHGTTPTTNQLGQLLGRDLHWISDQAVCAQIDPDLWFPEKGSEALGAKDLCRSCPLLTDCLAYALNHPETQGIWGATSETERRRLRKERGIPAPAARTIAHGTPGGARKHYRLQQLPVCEACRDAYSAYRGSAA